MVLRDKEHLQSTRDSAQAPEAAGRYADEKDVRCTTTAGGGIFPRNLEEDPSEDKTQQQMGMFGF